MSTSGGRLPHSRLRVGVFPHDGVLRSTILIAEDDELVLSTVTSACKLMGYEVISARDGREAWQLFEANHSHISLALLDQCMPFLTGSEVARRIRMIAPLLPLIMITADRDFEPPHQSEDEISAMTFLRKPQEIGSLLATIAAELSRDD